MEKKQFKAESKRLLELMVNSIYTHKEIFLRELISNASDALDKMYYKALTDPDITFNKDDYYIRIEADKDSRTLKVKDTGIGMTKKELENNLGTIAKSGSLEFKNAIEQKDEINIIGQFGVGFYSSFMVADKVTVISRAFGSGEAYKWESEGANGYAISPAEKAEMGTEVILKIKADTEDENYSDFLDEHRVRSLVKKYSDFIRYPIKMTVTKSRLKEGSDSEYETYREDEVLNSMVPIWRRNKGELKEEDYEKFYKEKHYGWDKPLKYIHINAEGTVSYRAILYIPSAAPFDYYTKDYQKGLELYSSGVLIMNKCADLLPDYFSFVQGLVDSENLSLNISREMLQHDRQLKFIAKRISEKVKGELLDMLKGEREKYEQFFKSFGRTLKYGVYSGYGINKEVLEDLLIFYSSREKKYVALEEYLSRMPEGQKYIYYVSGDDMDRMLKLPQAELVLDKGYEILLLTEEVDEFALRMMGSYKGKEFKSVSDSGDLGLNDKKEEKGEEGQNKELYSAIKEILKDKVKDVKPSKKLKTHPVCLSSEGLLSIEMEKFMRHMPGAQNLKAEKILEINEGHPVSGALKEAFEKDKEKFNLYVNLLYGQALIIEGLLPEDPVEFANGVCRLMN
mgnify:FL=1